MKTPSFIRKEYHGRELRRIDLALDPMEQFLHWLNEAVEEKIVEPNAMTLSTANAEGRPSSRTVLMKMADQKGLVFFTNYESRKARELSRNPYASAAFFWREMHRQIIIEGKVEKTDRELSAKYFAERPRASQISAAISHQDHPLEGRSVLEKAYIEMDKLYKDQEIPLPHFWGGFRLMPSRFEFWQGRPNRLHDRFVYTLKDNMWIIQRLSP